MKSLRKAFTPDPSAFKVAYTLLIENRAAATSIAAAKPIATSKVLPQPGAEAQVNCVLTVRIQQFV